MLLLSSKTTLGKCYVIYRIEWEWQLYVYLCECVWYLCEILSITKLIAKQVTCKGLGDFQMTIRDGIFRGIIRNVHISNI